MEDIIESNKHVERIEKLEEELNVRNNERIEKTNRVKAS